MSRFLRSHQNACGRPHSGLVFLLLMLAATAVAVIPLPPGDDSASDRTSKTRRTTNTVLAWTTPPSLNDTVNMENPACLWVLGCCGINGRFWDYDIVQGPLHGNPEFQLANSASYPPRGARFYGKVTSSSPHFTCSGEDEGGGCPEGYATFYEGYELNVPEVDCTVDYSDVYACMNSSGGIELPDDGPTWIRLNADATFTWWQPNNSNPPPGMEAIEGFPAGNYLGEEPITDGYTEIIPSGSVLACPHQGSQGDIYLWGALNGKLTIMSGRKIIVVGDILLADDPRVGPSDDRLGLLAGGAGPSAADGNLVIPDLIDPGVDGDRLIFANYVGPHCNAGVEVQNYRYRDREGILTIYGSVFQGTLRPTENTSGTAGYALNLTLDPRTCESPPPCFPTLEFER